MSTGTEHIKVRKGSYLILGLILFYRNCFSFLPKSMGEL